MAIHKETGLVSQAVREALGTLVSPQLAAQLVSRALASSGLLEIPESGRAIAHWIQGALHSEIEATVGNDAAELVAAQLAPIVAHAASQHDTSVRSGFASERPTGVMPAQASAPLKRDEYVRTARLKLTKEQQEELAGDREQGHTTRPQADFDESLPGEARRVIVACADARAIEALRRQLAGSASVQQVVDLVGLLDALDAPGLHKPIVLIDCQRPTVHVSSVSAIGEDLPAGTSIVLWGASETSWRELDRERVPSCRWVRCSQEATTDDVGTLCGMLLGT